MLSRFRRPDADLRIHVDKTVLSPGDGLEVRVDLVPKSNFDVRNGRLELICTETYIQKTSSQYGTHYQRKTETRFRVGDTFSDSGTLRSGVKYSTRMTFDVPADGAGTIRGTKVRDIEPGISWEVRADLDVASARDLSASCEITVVEPPKPEEVVSQPVVAEVSHRQCNITLVFSPHAVRSGDKLEGTLSIEPLMDMTVTDVRAELVREEKFGNDAQEHVVDQVTLEPELTLSAEDNREWRFRLDVGSVDVPSLKTDKSSVRWLVKGVLARAMRTDLRVEREISANF